MTSSEINGAPSGAPLATLAAEIRDELAAMEHDYHSALGHAIRAGELLIEAKAKTPHGEWLPWLEANFTLSGRTARDYMRLANWQGSANFDSVASALAAAPSERRPKAEPKAKATKSKAKTRGEQTFAPGDSVAYNDDVIAWVRKRVRQGWNRDRIIAAGRAGTDGYPEGAKPLGNGGAYAEVRQAIFRMEEAAAAKGDERPTPTEGGKRLHELRIERREIGESELNFLQQDVAKAVRALDGIDAIARIRPGEYTAEMVRDLYSDLERLREWTDRSLARVAALRGDLNLDQRLLGAQALADNGATPAERMAGARAVEKLRQRAAAQ